MATDGDVQRLTKSEATAGFILASMRRSARAPDWHGDYNFNHHEPKAATAKLRPKSECGFCHQASAKKDEVWTQFYRLLDD
jgi:hypothetical protein